MLFTILLYLAWYYFKLGSIYKESSQIINKKKKKKKTIQEREQSTSSWHMNTIAYTCISGKKKKLKKKHIYIFYHSVFVFVPQADFFMTAWISSKVACRCIYFFKTHLYYSLIFPTFQLYTPAGGLSYQCLTTAGADFI